MKKNLITIFKLAVTFLVLGVVVRKLGWDNIVDSLRQARLEWLLASLLVFVLSIMFGVVQWDLLLRNRGIRMSYWGSFRLYFIGMFFNNFILGAAAGDVVRVAYIKLANGSGKAGLAATFLDRFSGLWVMLGFALAGSVVLLRRGLVHGLPLATAVISLFASFALFGGILAFLMSTRLQTAFDRMLEKTPLPKKDMVRAILSQMLLEAKDHRLMVEVALLSTVVQFMRIGVHMLCGASLGLVGGHNYQYYFIFVPILAIIMIVPLPFGVREVVGGTLFALAGFEPRSAVVMGFLATLVGVVASSLGGIFFITSRAGQGNHENLDRRTTLQ